VVVDTAIAEVGVVIVDLTRTLGSKNTSWYFESTVVNSSSMGGLMIPSRLDMYYSLKALASIEA